MTYYYTPLEDFIKNLYHRSSIFVPSDICMMKIAGKLNLPVHYYDEKSEANFYKDKYRMFLDNRLSPPEQWEDFGHELCHVLRHYGDQSNMELLFYRLQEGQADNFMYHFCVPTFMLLDYHIANFMNVNDGTAFVSKTFNVTEKFAKERLIRFQKQIQQSKFDGEHRKMLEALYPKAKPYSEETNAILKKLYTNLDKKGLVV
ncbi:ImmA/IrrE family metallo-endopeptidase [Bacillus sp. CGMCC 1.16607]|uniref:ImmA/IrrE family metallo-endopeptidase n=1 Tax=Bacillus sp. CGMCC 1.16607 TaxID=3351842 RepID=UPI00362B8026